MTGKRAEDPSGSATNWSLLGDAAQGGPEAKSSLEAIARRYWGVIFAFVRATGQPAQDAADLTQGFVADVLLGRSLLASADKKRGRFRSLLRQSVVNYVRDRMRHERSRKRQPREGPPVKGDAAHLESIPSADFDRAERLFDAHWAAHVVRTAAERAAVRCRAEGRDIAWSVFERRTLRPQLFGDPPIPYHHLVREFGLVSIGQAAHLALVGRRAFVEELTAEVRATLGLPAPKDGEESSDLSDAVSEEIRALLAAAEGAG